eukprot:CAMPEP_0172471758 /NCGR_PEP_ID=MMETSP1065-20121228/67983_1 /TAXON_ID=265537 /ORGANISM="Amphiprora paludosa, Strain CCMP125" /LENGTH=536 /DNA_ID=CAMNT_0013229871 /DNA_START=153 /DNA_END=1763 /DNA_ORIENTATION=-
MELRRQLLDSVMLRIGGDAAATAAVLPRTHRSGAGKGSDNLSGPDQESGIFKRTRASLHDTYNNKDTTTSNTTGAVPAGMFDPPRKRCKVFGQNVSAIDIAAARRRMICYISQRLLVAQQQNQHQPSKTQSIMIPTLARRLEHALCQSASSWEAHLDETNWNARLDQMLSTLQRRSSLRRSDALQQKKVVQPGTVEMTSLQQKSLSTAEDMADEDGDASCRGVIVIDKSLARSRHNKAKMNKYQHGRSSLLARGNNHEGDDDNLSTTSEEHALCQSASSWEVHLDETNWNARLDQMLSTLQRRSLLRRPAALQKKVVQQPETVVEMTPPQQKSLSSAEDMVDEDCDASCRGVIVIDKSLARSTRHNKATMNKYQHGWSSLARENNHEGDDDNLSTTSVEMTSLQQKSLSTAEDMADEDGDASCRGVIVIDKSLARSRHNKAKMNKYQHGRSSLLARGNNHEGDDDNLSTTSDLTIEQEEYESEEPFSLELQQEEDAWIAQTEATLQQQQEDRRDSSQHQEGHADETSSDVVEFVAV